MNQNIRNCLFLLSFLIQFSVVLAQDTIAPVITLNPHILGCIELNCYNPDWVDPGCKAIDNVDGDITNTVMVYGNVNTRRINKYTITYIAKDKAGNADTAYRYVCVENTKGPFMPPYSFKPNVYRNGNEFLFTTYQLPLTRYYHKWLLDGDTLQSKTSEIALTYKLKDNNQHEICILENYCNSDTLISYCSYFSDTTSQYASRWIYADAFRDNDKNCIVSKGDEPIVSLLFESIKDDSNHFVPLIGSFEGYSVFGFIDTGKTYYIELKYPDYKDTLNDICLGRSKTIFPQTYLDTAIKLTFAFNCKSNVGDYNLDKLNLYGKNFPGQKSTLYAWVNNLNNNSASNCGHPDTGRVIFTIDGPARFIDYYRNGYTYDTISDKRFSFKPLQLSNIPQFKGLCPIIQVDTNAQMTDSILVTAYIETNAIESNKNNNSYSKYFKVSNSYDPNMKEVDKEIVSPGFKEPLHYTIYFQNTGNAEAINIKLLDTLSQSLDTSSFEFISSSHDVNVYQNGHYLKFDFKDIYLPDSNSDEVGSHGYVSYVIKPLQGMIKASSIKNTAYIYFDFNPPVVTNTAITTAVEDITDLKLQLYENLRIYPNPTTGILYIDDPIAISRNYIVRDFSGRVIHNGTCNGNTIDLGTLSTGIYTISLQTTLGTIHFKIVKM